MKWLITRKPFDDQRSQRLAQREKNNADYQVSEAGDYPGNNRVTMIKQKAQQVIWYPYQRIYGHAATCRPDNNNSDLLIVAHGSNGLSAYPCYSTAIKRLLLKRSR